MNAINKCNATEIIVNNKIYQSQINIMNWPIIYYVSKITNVCNCMIGPNLNN